MRRDFRLHELNSDEFERLVVRICVRWLGPGVTPFASGKDGGRDGKFHGRATCYPSVTSPLEGHCVLQAKHVAAANKSCSDRDFTRLLKSEHPKIESLVKNGICDHYIVFTNRKLTGGAEAQLVAALMQLKLTGAHIVGVERISLALEDYPEIRADLPNKDDSAPFRFDPNELVEVIKAFNDYTSDMPESGFNSAREFDTVRLRDQKNKTNGLTANYFQEIIVNDSMPYFNRIDDFLKNPRNKDFSALYHDAADELKAKILVSRSKFDSFDSVFAFLYEEIQGKRATLRGKRRLVSILLHYMYCNCDIGSKHFLQTGTA
jgi:hypothetical protein